MVAGGAARWGTGHKASFEDNESPGTPECEGIGLRDVTGCGSRVDPKVGPVWKNKM